MRSGLGALLRKGLKLIFVFRFPFCAVLHIPVFLKTQEISLMAQSLDFFFKIERSAKILVFQWFRAKKAD